MVRRPSPPADRRAAAPPAQPRADRPGWAIGLLVVDRPWLVLIAWDPGPVAPMDQVDAAVLRLFASAPDGVDELGGPGRRPGGDRVGRSAA